MIGFAGSRNLILSLALLALIGGGITLYMGTTNIMLLTQVTDEMRGRVMSMYSLIGAGVMPVGALVLGGAASALANAPLVIATGGAMHCSPSWLPVYRHGGEVHFARCPLIGVHSMV